MEVEPKFKVNDLVRFRYAQLISKAKPILYRVTKIINNNKPELEYPLDINYDIVGIDGHELLERVREKDLERGY